MLPRLFVGSSVQSLPVARAIQEGLERDAEVTVWSQGVFAPSVTTLDALVAALDRFDFGAFVFAPDDLVRIDDRSHRRVRDNVLFELGLFVGRYGPARNVFVVPRGRTDFRLPSDLHGVTPVSYEPDRGDGNLQAALGPACNRIRRLLERHGRPASSSATTARPQAGWPVVPPPEVRERAGAAGREHYLSYVYSVVRTYFDRAVRALRREHPEVEAHLEDVGRRAFLCEVTAGGRPWKRCKVWISDAGPGTRGLAYDERDAAGETLHELLVLSDALTLTPQFAAYERPDPLTPPETAEHLWRTFVRAS